MSLDVHPLTKSRWEDLVDLFNRPGGSIVRGCWCMHYRRSGSAGHGGGGQSNKRAMKSLVGSGIVPGLIGYKDGRPIGWISLGPREDYRRLERSPVMKRVDDKPVWSIVCFYVDPTAKRRGVATALLEAALDHARRQGVRLVEAYPVREGHMNIDAYTGYLPMFLDAGFEVVRDAGRRQVVRRRVRPSPRGSTP